jgi:hypothetical protein
MRWLFTAAASSLRADRIDTSWTAFVSRTTELVSVTPLSFHSWPLITLFFYHPSQARPFVKSLLFVEGRIAKVHRLVAVSVLLETKGDTPQRREARKPFENSILKIYEQ